MSMLLGQTASAKGLLGKVVDAVEEAGQDTIDAAVEPVKKVLPREVTKHTDKAAEFVIEKREKLETAADKFVDDPLLYLAQLPGSVMADVCSAPVQYYGKALQEQASGKWQHLPQKLIDAIQDNYSVDLNSVQFVEGVSTSNGAAQTIGKRIYFPRRIDLTDYDDMHWMLHELEHTVQFSNATYGTAGKLCEYVAKAIGTGAQHDRIDMERAAEAKANYLVDEALASITGSGSGASMAQQIDSHQIVITNTTNIPITFEMATQYIANEPETLGPGEWSVFTGDERDSEFYVRIGTSTWRGPVSREYTIPGGANTIIAANAYGIFELYNAE